MSWLLGTILPIILDWLYKKGASLIALFAKEQEEKKKNDEAAKKAESDDDTSGLFGGNG